MLALRVVVLALLVVGSLGSSYNFFPSFWTNGGGSNDCRTIDNLEARMRLALLDNDVDDNGDINDIDFGHDGIRYNSDENLCDVTEAESKTYGSCRYGWSDNYGQFLFNRFDANGDGILNSLDGSAGFTLTTTQFLRLQYTRFLNVYCVIPGNSDKDPDCARAAAMPVPDFMN